MTASATEKDQSFTTRSPNTPADVLPEDIILQYIIKPTIGKHSHITAFIYFLPIFSYSWNCNASSTTPICKHSLNYGVIFFLLAPIVLMWYVIYKQWVHRRRSVRQEGSVESV